VDFSWYSSNNTDGLDIAEILLKVRLNTITPNLQMELHFVRTVLCIKAILL
jgi:hypothetical protein